MTLPRIVPAFAIISALSLSGLCLGSCTAKVDSRRGDGNSVGGTSGSGGSGSSSGTGGSSTTATHEGVKQRCETSTEGPPLLRRLTLVEFERTLRAIFPTATSSWGGLGLGADPNSALGFSNDASVLVVGEQTASDILKASEAVADLVTDPTTLAGILPCSQANPDAACAGEFATTYGQRLYRRPLATEEVQELVDHFNSVAARSDFNTGLKWMLVGMIQSPASLYRSEVGADDGNGYALSQFEIATELAYSFAGSTPDSELLAKAERGELNSPDVLVSEAKRLLSTPQGQEVIRQFFREWIKYEKIGNKVKNTVTNFEQVRVSMAEETRRFIDEIVFQRGGNVNDLLTAPYTFVDATLAQHYGYGTGATDFTLTDRPPNWGVGILAQGSILATNAHEESSSPTLRGLVVFERLFCNERPPVPPVVPSIEAPAPGAKTTRERYEMSHAADDVCNSCHHAFDPIGFGFEHFDEAGRYRADENGLPIDATGAVVRPGEKTALFEFDGLQELATNAAQTPEVTDCVSGLMIAYMYGGGGGAACLAEEARTALASGELNIVDFLASLAGTPHFTRRKLP